MPLSEVHKKKLKTNLAILAVILGFCALIWGVSMVKISGGG